MPKTRLTDNVMCPCGHSRGSHLRKWARCEECDDGLCTRFEAYMEDGRPVCSICQTTTCDPTACAAEEEADG